MSLAVTFGANLRHHRKIKGLTQSALAEQVSLSTEMISKMERGVASPSFESIEKISEVLAIPEAALFGGSSAIADHDDRSQFISKINIKISRLKNNELAILEKLISAIID